MQRVVVLSSLFDFLFGAIAKLVGIRDGKPFKTIGRNLQHRWASVAIGTLDGRLEFGANFIHMISIDEIPFDVVARSTLGQ